MCLTTNVRFRDQCSAEATFDTPVPQKIEGKQFATCTSWASWGRPHGGRRGKGGHHARKKVRLSEMKYVRRLVEWNSMGPRWDLIQPGIAAAASGAAAAAATKNAPISFSVKRIGPPKLLGIHQSRWCPDFFSVGIFVEPSVVFWLLTVRSN